MKKLVKQLVGEIAWHRLGQARQEFKWRKITDHSAPELKKYIENLLPFSNGYYVEVGANDGRSFSNTFVLEKTKNWSGILVEPILHKHFESHIYRDVTRNEFVYGACVASDYPDSIVKMYFSNLMTTSDTGNSKDWAEAGSIFLNAGEKVLPFWAPALLLGEIILKSEVRVVDFLSIDVEGAELSVLKGVDLNKIQIDLILIETNRDSAAIDFLKANNYEHIVDLEVNHFFKRRI
jgi:FkbM family methyltransferase